MVSVSAQALPGTYGHEGLSTEWKGWWLPAGPIAMKLDPETLAPTTRTFPAHSSAVSRVRHYLRSQAAEAGVAREATDDLVLAVTEAWTNSLRHARTDWIDVTVHLMDDRVEVWVRDDGLFRQRIPLRGLELEGGHGVPLMMALMDEVHITKGIPRRPGTIVRLVRYL